MLVYWSACLTSIIFTWLAIHIKHNKKNEGIAYWGLVTLFSAFPLIFIAAIRYNVGKDYLSYYNYYLGILGGAQKGRYEILYYLVNKFVAFFDLSAPWLFGLVAIIFLLPVYKRIISDSPYRSMSVFLLLGMTYYFFFLNGTRQMLGATFLLASIPFIEQRRFIPFAICVLIATGFHTTSIVFFGVYFLATFDFSRKILILLTICLFLVGQTLGDFINGLIGNLEYYSDYMQTSLTNQSQGYIVLLMNIVLLAFCTIFYQRNNTKFRIYYNLQVLALWASSLTGKIVLVERFRMVFGLASIILIPITLKGIKDKKIRYSCMAIIVILYFVYAMYTVGVQNSNTVLPYQTIFQM